MWRRATPSLSAYLLLALPQTLASASGKDSERELLTYLADPLAALKACALCRAFVRNCPSQHQDSYLVLSAASPRSGDPADVRTTAHVSMLLTSLQCAPAPARPQTPQVMVTVSLLSMHAEDEQYLDERNTLLLVRCCASPAVL